MSGQFPFSRRVFLPQVVACGSAVVALGTRVQQPAEVDEKDPPAAALGHVADTTKTGAKKSFKHANDQDCSGW